MSVPTLLKTVTMFSLPQKARVLDLYKRLIRLSKTWTSASGDAAQSAKESEYIKLEARTLFRNNAHLTDPKVIEVRNLSAPEHTYLNISVVDVFFVIVFAGPYP